MIGNVNLQQAAKDPHAPRWVRLLWRNTKWKRAVIEPLNAQQLQDLLLRRPRKTVVIVNLGTYKSLKKLSTYHGIFVGVPSIRSIYSLRYVTA